MSMFTTAKLSNPEIQVLLDSFTGTVTVCPKGKKAKYDGFRHPSSTGAKGTKAFSLKNQGIYLR